MPDEEQAPTTTTPTAAQPAVLAPPAPPETKRKRHQRQPGLGADFITTEELLAKLPICRKTLFNYCDNGKLPYVKLGRRIIFHWPSVQSALLRQQRGGCV
ncbi:MAG: helix-turn-helix domain-containing protein [Verrucomicrobia bacterium]|nr:helix-turn-helix domain-containing protein [Verrucomicrobiota bacterium]